MASNPLQRALFRGDGTRIVSELNKLFVRDEDLKEPVFDVRKYGASTLAVDNRVAVQDAINAAQSSGGGIVWIPEKYKISSSGGNIGFSSQLPYGLRISSDNITLEGPGGLDFRGLYGILGSEYYGIAIGTAIGLTNRIGLENVHELAGSYAKAVRVLTFATTSHAANYEPGDWVYIRTGNLITATTSIADCEINQVVAVDTNAGTITLRWPTTKPYAQEWFISGTTGKTSTNSTANPAKYGVKNLSRPSNWIIQQPIFRNIQFFADTAYTFVTAFHPIGMTFDGVTAHLSGSLAQGTSRGTRLLNSRIHIDPPGGSTPTRDCQTHWIAAGDTHSTDFLMDNCDLSSTGNGWIHVHEGSAQITLKNSTLVSVDGATQWGSGTGYSAVNIESRGYDINVDGLTIRGTGASASGIRVAGDCNGGGRIRGCEIDGISATTAISVGSDNWHVAADNETHGKIIRRSLSFTQPGAQANVGVTSSEPRTLQGWLTPTNPTLTLGVIPSESAIVFKVVNVNTAVDGTTPQVKIGYDGTSTTERAWVDLTDVASASPPAKTPVMGVGNHYLDSQRTAKAYLVWGATPPTAGRVYVSLTYVPAVVRPT